MDNSDKRRHMRLMHQAKIKVTVPVIAQVFELKMKDFSESGLFLLSSEDTMPPLGALVQVQTTEIEDAPVQPAKVMRVEPGVGFGVEFVRE